MGTVEQDLARHERFEDQRDREESAKEEAIETETRRLMDLPATAILAEATALPGLLGIEMSLVVGRIAEVIVDTRAPDDGFDQDNRPVPRYWEGP